VLVAESFGQIIGIIVLKYSEGVLLSVSYFYCHDQELLLFSLGGVLGIVSVGFLVITARS
jgi:hypothetical protein